jgi:protein gp37
MTQRREVFTLEARKLALKEFTDKARRLFLTSLSDEEIAQIAKQMIQDVADVVRARGSEKKQ